MSRTLWTFIHRDYGYCFNDMIAGLFSQGYTLDDVMQRGFALLADSGEVNLLNEYKNWIKLLTYHQQEDILAVFLKDDSFDNEALPDYINRLYRKLQSITHSGIHTSSVEQFKEFLKQIVLAVYASKVINVRAHLLIVYSDLLMKARHAIAGQDQPRDLRVTGDSLVASSSSEIKNEFTEGVNARLREFVTGYINQFYINLIQSPTKELQTKMQVEDGYELFSPSDDLREIKSGKLHYQNVWFALSKIKTLKNCSPLQRVVINSVTQLGISAPVNITSPNQVVVSVNHSFTTITCPLLYYQNIKGHYYNAQNGHRSVQAILASDENRTHFQTTVALNMGLFLQCEDLIRKNHWRELRAFLMGGHDFYLTGLLRNWLVNPQKNKEKVKSGVMTLGEEKVCYVLDKVGLQSMSDAMLSNLAAHSRAVADLCLERLGLEKIPSELLIDLLRYYPDLLQKHFPPNSKVAKRLDIKLWRDLLMGSTEEALHVFFNFIKKNAALLTALESTFYDEMQCLKALIPQELADAAVVESWKKCGEQAKERVLAQFRLMSKQTPREILVAPWLDFYANFFEKYRHDNNNRLHDCMHDFNMLCIEATVVDAKQEQDRYLKLPNSAIVRDQLAMIDPELAILRGFYGFLAKEIKTWVPDSTPLVKQIINTRSEFELFEFVMQAYLLKRQDNTLPVTDAVLSYARECLHTKLMGKGAFLNRGAEEAQGLQAYKTLSAIADYESRINYQMLAHFFISFPVHPAASVIFPNLHALLELVLTNPSSFNYFMSALPKQIGLNRFVDLFVICTHYPFAFLSNLYQYNKNTAAKMLQAYCKTDRGLPAITLNVTADQFMHFIMLIVSSPLLTANQKIKDLIEQNQFRTRFAQCLSRCDFLQNTPPCDVAKIVAWCLARPTLVSHEDTMKYIIALCVASPMHLQCLDPIFQDFSQLEKSLHLLKGKKLDFFSYFFLVTTTPSMRDFKENFRKALNESATLHELLLQSINEELLGHFESPDLSEAADDALIMLYGLTYFHSCRISNLPPVERAENKSFQEQCERVKKEIVKLDHVASMFTDRPGNDFRWYTFLPGFVNNESDHSQFLKTHIPSLIEHGEPSMLFYVIECLEASVKYRPFLNSVHVFPKLLLGALDPKTSRSVRPYLKGSEFYKLIQDDDMKLLRQGLLTIKINDELRDELSSLVDVAVSKATLSQKAVFVSLNPWWKEASTTDCLTPVAETEKQASMMLRSIISRAVPGSAARAHHDAADHSLANAAALTPNN